MLNDKLVNIASAALRAEKISPELPRKEQLRAALEDNGFSADEIARLLRNIAYNAEKDSDSLKAMELATRLLGHNAEDRGSSIPNIQIIVQGAGDVNAIFVPQVS
jgi:hypothetical protein